MSCSGDEKLRVFAVIDVVRYPTEEERKVEPSADDDNSPETEIERLQPGRVLRPTAAYTAIRRIFRLLL